MVLTICTVQLEIDYCFEIGFEKLSWIDYCFEIGFEKLSCKKKISMTRKVYIYLQEFPHFSLFTCISVKNISYCVCTLLQYLISTTAFWFFINAVVFISLPAIINVNNDFTHIGFSLHGQPGLATQFTATFLIIFYTSLRETLDK